MRILSYSESILLADEMSEFCVCAERCEKLLNKLIDDYFSDLEQKKLDAYDAGYIGDILRLLRDDLHSPARLVIWSALSVALNFKPRRTEIFLRSVI